MIYLNVTFKSMEGAEKLARELVQQRVAGIVSVAPIKSFYPVDGEVAVRDEALLKITTIDSKVQEVEERELIQKSRKKRQRNIRLGS